MNVECLTPGYFAEERETDCERGGRICERSVGTGDRNRLVWSLRCHAG